MKNNYESETIMKINLPEKDYMLATRTVININLMTQIVISYSSSYKDTIRIYFGNPISDDEMLEKVKEFLYITKTEYINIETLPENVLEL